MAVKIFSEICTTVYEPFHRPAQSMDEVSANLVKFTGRYAIFTGCSAVILGILIKCLKPMRSLPRYLFTVSWSGCATSAAVLAFFVYSCVIDKKDQIEKRNRNTIRFERQIQIGHAFGAIACFLLSHIFEKNSPIVAITRHLYRPLVWTSFTAGGIRFFHERQMKAVYRESGR